MAFDIAWSASAASDLEQIVRYIALDDPQAAARLGEGIFDSLEQIALFPRSGRVVPEQGIDSIRELVYTPYRIVYLIDDARRGLRIIRIWHSAKGAVKLD